MGINEQNQGDYQKLDPRSADKVREVEEEQFIQGILGINRDRVARLFSMRSVRRGGDTPDTLARDITENLDRRTGGMDTAIRRQVQTDISDNLREAQRQERSAPETIGVTERLQRRTREFAAAVRRALPADLLERSGSREQLGNSWTLPGITIASQTGSLEIDLTHNFWLNRIQSEQELIDTLDGARLGDIGITHPAGPTATLSPTDAATIARSVSGRSTDQFHRRLLRQNTRTLLSDHQVSSLNVDTAVQLVLDNDHIRRSIAPSSTDTAQVELNNLVQEKRVTESLLQLKAVDYPNITSSLGSWNGIRRAIGRVDTQTRTLGSASTGTSINLDTIGAGTSYTVTGRRDEMATLMRQLNEKKRELEEMDNKIQRYANVLAGIRDDVAAIQTRKSAGTLRILNMIRPGGTPDDHRFTGTDTPQVVANELRSTLDLRSGADEYDADIAAQRTAVKDAREGKNMLTGRDAVLKVYDEYYRRVQKLDPRRAEEARQALYARNEQGREEGEARGEAVDELMGRQQGESVLNISNSAHEFTHGRAEDIVCKLAETNEINAPTQGTRSLIRLGARRNGAAPKWSALPYPRLMTAYAALKKLSEDSSSPIALRRTGYLRRQMDEITTLLADKYTEQVELDYGRITESDAEATERRAQGERNRKQRLLRLLIHNPVPPTYEERATNAIEATASRVRRVRRGIASAGRATGRFVANRTKNVVLGEGSNANPLTYPAKGIKGFARWAVTPLG